MAKSTTNPHRFDPYKNFKFLVKIAGRPVAGIAAVTGLKVSVRKLPGIRKYPNLTLKRGMTRNAKFLKWATALSDSRLDVVIEIHDAAGRLEKAYKVHRGWVSKYEAATLKASGNEVAIESLTLAHEGIEMMRR